MLIARTEEKILFCTSTESIPVIVVLKIAQTAIAKEFKAVPTTVWSAFNLIETNESKKENKMPARIATRTARR